jgi:hypothetical protein
VTEASASDIQGSPDYELFTGTFTEAMDSIGLRWDILTDPDFPVEFQNTMPDFSTMAADSFPIIRYTGWMSGDFVGRGLLIVDGVFDPGAGAYWRGIVLAGHVDDIIQGRVDGLLVGGLSGPNSYPTVDFQTVAQYHSCDVYGANETLSYLELVNNTMFEAR